MRVTKREDDLLALHVGFVTNTDDVHLPAEPGSDADDRVVRQRASEPVQRRLIVGTTFGAQLLAFDFEVDARAGSESSAFLSDL
jgi:hypothetical protein